MIRAEFQHTVEDYREYGATARNFGPLSRRILNPRSGLNPGITQTSWGSLILFLGIGVVAVGMGGMGLQGWRGCFLIAAPLGFLFLVVVWAMRPSASAATWEKSFSALTEPQRAAVVEVDGDAFRFIGPQWNAAVRWHAIAGLNETPNLLLITSRSSLTYIVPKRAFASDEQRQAFVELIRSKISSNPMV